MRTSILSFTMSSKNRKEIAELSTPGQAKRFVRLWSIPKEFYDKRLSIMEGLVLKKFVNNSELRRKLIDTCPEELIEGNSWGDVFWGQVHTAKGWTGRNELGKILTEARNKLKQENKI